MKTGATGPIARNIPSTSQEQATGLDGHGAWKGLSETQNIGTTGAGNTGAEPE